MQQYVEGIRGGFAITAAYVAVPLTPAGTRMYLAFDTIIITDFASSRPFHCFLPSIYTNPLHTRTSYLQQHALINYCIVPLGSNLSFLQSLSDSFATCLAGMR